MAWHERFDGGGRRVWKSDSEVKHENDGAGFGLVVIMAIVSLFSTGMVVERFVCPRLMPVWLYMLIAAAIGLFLVIGLYACMRAYGVVIFMVLGVACAIYLGWTHESHEKKLHTQAGEELNSRIASEIQVKVGLPLIEQLESLGDPSRIHLLYELAGPISANKDKPNGDCRLKELGSRLSAKHGDWVCKECWLTYIDKSDEFMARYTFEANVRIQLKDGVVSSVSMR